MNKNNSMENKLQTLNKGEIDACYLDNSLEKVRIGNLTIPTNKFLRFAMELVRNKNSQKSLLTEEREITGMVEYNGISNPKKVIFGAYEIKGGEFGCLVDKLLYEGASKRNGKNII